MALQLNPKTGIVMIKRALNQFGFHRFINKPTYLLQNSSSCINLIIKSQPEIVVESDFTHLFIQIVIVK